MKAEFLAIAAVTLDGKIAKHKNHLSNWTSREDKVFLHAILNKSDCIIVGNNTYKTAKKPLAKRNCIVLTSKVSEPAVKSKKLMFANPRLSDLRKLITAKKYRRVAILGGAQTYSYCLENNMLDELFITIEPIVFGQGIGLFASKTFFDKSFRLISVKKLNKKGSLLLRYKKIT